jgi:hypothetical protein
MEPRLKTSSYYELCARFDCLLIVYQRTLAGGRSVAMIGLNIGGGDNASLYRDGALGGHAAGRAQQPPLHPPYTRYTHHIYPLYTPHTPLTHPLHTSYTLPTPPLYTSYS